MSGAERGDAWTEERSDEGRRWLERGAERTGDTVRVSTGVARLCADPGLVEGGGRLGLVTNFTGLMPDLRSNVAALRQSGVALTVLFGPEHGLQGTAQAGFSEQAETDPDSGLPLYDTYQKTGPELDDVIVRSGVDTILYDLQDVGSRFYTYVWTMFDVMVSAARTGRRFVVLDRPNPIGGTRAEGPLLRPDFASFVGRSSIPIRHGLTCGELARYLNSAAVYEAAGSPVDLDVIALSGWDRASLADETGLPWVLPSPNLPTLDTALVYPGTCLFEGTNLSEGRGTTRPFELIGAPYVDDRWAKTLNALELPGVRFRDTSFSPTFHKYAGVAVRGVQVHVTERSTFAPVATAVHMIDALVSLYPDDFAWREAQPGRPHFIDLLWGSDVLRRTVGSAGIDELVGPIDAPTAWTDEEVLLYS